MTWEVNFVKSFSRVIFNSYQNLNMFDSRLHIHITWIYTQKSLHQDVHFSIFLKNEIFSSVQFSHSVVSDSLRPHESQHTRPPCPSPTPGVHSNSCPLSRWCHPAISSSVVPFSSCPQSLPASGSFPMSQLFAWHGQSTGVSALASVQLQYPKYLYSVLG